MKNENLINEGNKLIAEFMGLSGRVNEMGQFVCHHPIGSGWHSMEVPVQYHSSWEYLMPVIARCHTMKSPTQPHTVTNWSNADRIQSRINPNDFFRNRVFSAWGTVVEFIKWYNEEKSKS